MLVFFSFVAGGGGTKGSFSGARAELLKRLLASSSLSGRIEQLDSHWADFD